MPDRLSERRAIGADLVVRHSDSGSLNLIRTQGRRRGLEIGPRFRLRNPNGDVFAALFSRRIREFA